MRVKGWRKGGQVSTGRSMEEGLYTITQEPPPPFILLPTAHSTRFQLFLSLYRLPPPFSVTVIIIIENGGEKAEREIVVVLRVCGEWRVRRLPTFNSLPRVTRHRGSLPVFSFLSPNYSTSPNISNY